MQPAEIQFAQRLASHEKGIRDRAVRKLRQYISVKTQRETGGFSQEELLKIWKGLFYCMWVQDEPPLQEELANTISQLVHAVNNPEAQRLFLRTFWQTMNREWTGIDRLRLDRFYMLIRLVLRECFEVLKQTGWEESRVQLLLDVLMKEVLHPESQSPDAVKFHFIDIYLDELSKVGGKELLADQNLKFIDPFCRIAAKTKDHALVQTIARGVFEVIVDQSPFVPEAAVEELHTKVGDGHLSEGERAGEEVTWRGTFRKRKTALGKCYSRKDGVGGEGAGDGGGSVEDTGPLLQFDYKAIADRLLEMTNRKNIPPFNRKRLSKLIKKFQDLSEGGIPRLGFTKDFSTDEEDPTFSQGRHKKRGNKPLGKPDVEKGKGNEFFMAEGEERKGGVQKRKRKKKKNHLRHGHLGSGNAAVPALQNGGSEPEGGPGRAQKPGVAEPGAGAAPSPQEQSGSERPPSHPPTRSRRKRARKRSPRFQGLTLESAASPLEDLRQGGLSNGHGQALASQAFPASGAPAPKRKRKPKAPWVNGSPPTLAWPPPQEEGPAASPADGEDCPASLPPGGRLKKKKGEPSRLDLYNPGMQKTAIFKKRKKMKEMLNLVEHSRILESELKRVQTLGSSGAFSPLKKKLRTENDFVKFDTPFLPKPLFFRKAKSSPATSVTPAMQLNKTPSSSKKVTFGLNRNMTAEFKKTDKSILVSPTGASRVAFNPEQRPLHGVLKTPTSSPASTPLGTKKPLTATPKRRPTAMDFF
ncbi:ribosomal RNA processing protein 1 homolog B isoform X1 [Artibeus jamaicensis]|uniref:ribosomal RNA processing protein 1 homolog B isoform X1 n=2 Tax=Artibeus jamaicensis TaxID=9417 RepID=UPI00235AEBEF|nr:ribosomal RNA processing protein 1 homolog B isoform X1 [Artibeus jamaicensis]